MILSQLLRELFRQRSTGGPKLDQAGNDKRPCVLNVGGGSKQIPIPDHYKGWNHLLLDIDSAGAPDIVCDARELATLAAERFDAIYCSHNLEHYYRHDALRVLRGFLHALKPGGFAEIRVPDLKFVMEHVVKAKMDIDDILYQSAGGPISVRDVIYGWANQIERSGADFYAHKNGFTPSSLKAILRETGFPIVMVAERNEIFEVRALAFKAEPTDEQRALLGL